MTETILADLKLDISSLRLIPSRGGCFEVWVNEEQIYSKLSTGEFPDETAILDEVRKRNPANM